MRFKAGLLTLLAFLVLVASAQAFQWHMRYGQAKHASKSFAKELCRESRGCVGYGVGQCLRRSPSRFDCRVGTLYVGEAPATGEEGEEGEEETDVECDLVLHWGVDHGGYLTLKRHGPPHCFQVPG